MKEVAVDSTKSISHSFNSFNELEAKQFDPEFETGLEAMQPLHRFENISINQNESSGPFIQRKCESCQEEEEIIQRKPQGTASAISSKPIPSAQRTNLEAQFGQSLLSIRIHDNEQAAALARQQNAIAFAAGRDIYFSQGAYQPQTAVGNWILTHEVTHAVQQNLQAGVEPDKLSRNANAALESQANQNAFGQSATISNNQPAAVMALTPAEFQAQLGSTPEQTLAISNLFANPTFAAIWAWMGSCTATPAQDLGPIALLVTPGLMIRGAERFGGYDPVSRTLEINPTKPEHIANPAEMVDTIFHELIHAADGVDADCQSAGSAAAPLGGAATSTTPVDRRGAVRTGTETAFNRSHGPGASNPCEEFIDINSIAQTLVTNAIQENIQTTGIGHPTLTFVNVIIRSDPAALTFYESCRTSACALSGASRSTALTSCSSETIARFLPNSLLSTILPAHLHFDSSDTTVKASDVGKLKLVARYLVHHPAQTVRIVGHTDESGGRRMNEGIGQARADDVQRNLLALGVSPGQIISATSQGENDTLSTTRSERFRDRRVEIIP